MSILQQRHTASTDSVKYENEATTICRARETAGGERGAFSNAHGDVPMSFLQQRHASNTHRNDDHNHNNTEKEDKATAKKERRKIILRHPLTFYKKKTQDA